MAQSEVKLWLKAALAKQDIKHFSVQISGSSEKGEGFAGDILFVSVRGTDKDGIEKKYEFVLKCSKPSEALRESTVIQDIFLNEIYVYDKIFPLFQKFQTDKGVDDSFQSVPRCYGTFTSKSREVVILENLKSKGYELWTYKKPLTRNHINLVVKEYGKLHAISVALKEQQPEQFQKVIDGYVDIWTKFVETSDISSVFEKLVKEIYDLLKSEMSEQDSQKWLSFQRQVRFVMTDLAQNVDGLKVVTHGDCWNNNFMYQHTNDNKDLVSKVAILDWQNSKYSSPVFDLSYFLFSCISDEDIDDMDTILEDYYKSFTGFLKRLGSNFGNEYSLERFLEEWRKYSKNGILQALLPLKLSFSEEDDIPDIAKTVESGQDVAKAFLVDIKNKTGFKNRVKPIVKHVIEFDLV
jgi:thiamine kinase-like enzyme